MRSARDVAWDVAAWLGIVGGAIGVVVAAGTCLIFLLFALGTQLDAASRRGGPALNAMLVGLLPLLGLAIAAVAFGAGVGLLRRKPYGRTLTLVFGPIAAVDGVFSIVDVWQGLLSRAVNGPTMATRLMRVAVQTPFYAGVIVGVALLCRSVYLNRAAFHGEAEGVSAAR